MSQAAFLAAYLGLALLGFGATLHPDVRRLALWARLGISFGTGALVLALAGLVLSLVGIHWSPLSLTLSGLVASVPLVVMWIRRSAPPRRPFRMGLLVAVLSAVIVVLALAHLGFSLVTSHGTSPDYLFFWGLKGVRFAQAQGIDAEFLGSKYAVHTHLNYPPLYPTTLSWSALWGGRMHWRVGLLTSLVWVAATVPVVLGLLRRRLTDGQAAAVTAYWTAALAISLVVSYSGGNAEPPLLYFLTIAGAAVLVEKPNGSTPSRFLPALGLCGAVLTKNEGLVSAGLIVLGVLLRDLRLRRPGWVRGLVPLVLAPCVALGLWVLFELIHGLPLTDPVRERALALHFDDLPEIALASLKHLAAGTWGLSWLIPLGLLIASRASLVRLLPGLVQSAGVLLFALVYYLHVVGIPPVVLVEWTLPRLSQPALSLLILTAGLACFDSRREPSA